MVVPLLLLYGCEAGSITVGTLDSGPPDGAPPVTDTSPDTADTAIEDAGENPATVAPVVVFDPPSQTFADSLAVSMTLATGETARYTTDGSDPSRGAAWSGSLRLTDSTQVRVMVTGPTGLTTYGSASYVALDADAVPFTSNLPLVVLSTAGSLPTDDDAYAPIALQIHDAPADGRASLLGEATTSARAGLRVRGSSTSSEPKHSYALEVRDEDTDDDHNLALLDMPADSDWVLYAPLDFDRSFIRNALVFQLSRDIGRYAPRTRFVEVFTSSRGRPASLDTYVGVYVLMERIKRSDDRVAVTPMNPEDLAEPEVTGGYIFKRDRVGTGEDGFDAGEARGRYQFDDPLVNVYPREETIAREQAQYLSDAVDTFADGLAAPDGISPDGLPWQDHIDQPAWIDHHILDMFTKNPDALRLSSYMYKDREGPIVAGPVWDFDRAMYPSDDTRAEDPTWWDARNVTWDCTAIFEYGWYADLFADPDFSAAYWARLQELLDDQLSVAHIEGIIDDMADELSEAAPRNYAAWSSYPPRGGSFAAEIALLKTWIEARHAWIAGCLQAHPDDPTTCQGD